MWLTPNIGVSSLDLSRGSVAAPARRANNEKAMKGGTSIAVGVGIGYLLGRTRKMRFALGVMMAKRSSDIPGELLERGTSLLKSSADLTQLTDTVRDELLGAARSAAVTAASNQLDSLNTRLQQGSSLLSGDSLLSGKDRERAPAAEPDDEGEPEVLDVESSDEDLEEVDSGDREEDREPPAPRTRKSAAPPRAEDDFSDFHYS